MSNQEQSLFKSNNCRPSNVEKDWSVSNYLPPPFSPDAYQQQPEIVSAYIVEDSVEQNDSSKHDEGKNVLDKNVFELETMCVTSTLQIYSFVIISSLTNLS